MVHRAIGGPGHGDRYYLRRISRRPGPRDSIRSQRSGRSRRVSRLPGSRRLFEGVAIAIDALRANKVRAALTILGIAVGVFVVVAMAAAIHGINVSVAKDIESAGATTFFVERFPVDFNACDGTDETCPWIHNPPIRLGEAALPSAGCRRSPGVTTEIDFAGSFKYADRTLAAAQIQGFSPGWTNTDGGDINPGRSFTMQENASGAQVALINDKMAERLFPFGDPVGKSVLINNSPYADHRPVSLPSEFLSSAASARLAILPLQTLLRHFTAQEGDAQLIIKPRDGTAVTKPSTMSRHRFAAPAASARPRKAISSS